MNLNINIWLSISLKLSHTMFKSFHTVTNFAKNFTHRNHFYKVNMAPGLQVKIAVQKMWKCWAQSSYVYPNCAGIEWIAQDCVKILQSRIVLNCSRIVWIVWGLWPICGLAIGISIQQIHLQLTKSWQNPISWLM